MSQSNCNVLCWNVRGLNDAAKRASVRNMIFSSGATIVCLQETKIANWTTTLLCQILGPSQSVALPATGTSGGILLAAHDRFSNSSPRIPLITRYLLLLHYWLMAQIGPL
jgi:exonuclease III